MGRASKERSLISARLTLCAVSLIHSSISRGSTILVEHQNGKRNFSEAAATILSKIPPNNSKLTYVWEQYLFHYVSEGGIIYLVMADDSVGRRMPFAFLADLQRKFTSEYDSETIHSSNPYGLNEFESELSKLMSTYTDAPPPDALRQAQTDLGNVKDIMVNNIDAILSRGERIELLVDKTDSLSGQAWAFKRGAKNVRRQMWWKNMKVMALCGIVGVLLVYFFVASFCGFTLTHCRS